MRGIWFSSGSCKGLFLFLKILTLEERGDKGIETQEERQGKMLLHTEYSLLSLLHNQEGVVHHHGLFQVPLENEFVPIEHPLEWSLCFPVSLLFYGDL